MMKKFCNRDVLVGIKTRDSRTVVRQSNVYIYIERVHYNAVQYLIVYLRSEFRCMFRDIHIGNHHVRHSNIFLRSCTGCKSTDSFLKYTKKNEEKTLFEEIIVIDGILLLMRSYTLWR